MLILMGLPIAQALLGEQVEGHGCTLDGGGSLGRRHTQQPWAQTHAAAARRHPTSGGAGRRLRSDRGWFGILAPGRDRPPGKLRCPEWPRCIKRTCQGLLSVRRTKSWISSSLTPPRRTQLIFKISNPASSAARIPERTASSPSTRVMAW